MSAPREFRRSTALAVACASAALVIGGLELASRLLIPNRYFVWPPNFHARFDAGDHISPGVEFPGNLTINAAGMRGDLPAADTRYRILAVGGSTTICVYLDDARAWPYVLQRELNAALGQHAVWVGNVGRPGHNTVHHILQVEKLLDQHPDIDMVVLLLGINDLISALTSIAYPELSVEPDAQQKLVMSFSFFPGWDDETPWYERNLIGRLRRLSSWRPLPGTAELQPMDEKGEFVATLRRFRQQAGRLRDDLPDLREARAGYAERVRQIVRIGRARDVRMLFLTQPTLWRSDLTPDQQKRIWAGGPPLHHLRAGATYYSVGALAAAMAQFNATLLEVCRDEGVECLDVASTIERTPVLLYDDAHFTDRGSELLASQLAAYLQEFDPLRPARPDRAGS